MSTSLDSLGSIVHVGDTIKVLLFDLGGVLIELGQNPFPLNWLVGDKKFELSDWFKSEVAQQFEQGLISPNEFASAIKNDLSLPTSVEEICAEFTKWPIGHFEGTHELLMKLKEKYTLAILTNTNELHWPRIIGEFGILNYSEHIFASHRLKLAKPSLEIYDYVISELCVLPSEIIFFDDNESNIEAAKTVGIESHLVKGHVELVQKLKQLKLLAS